MCVVCYCVIAAPYVRSVVSFHTFTVLMTIMNAQWTMSSIYSLNVFLSVSISETYHYQYHIIPLKPSYTLCIMESLVRYRKVGGFMVVTQCCNILSYLAQ